MISAAAMWDVKIKGLHLRKQKTKECYYLFYRTRQGAQRRPKLGEHPAITLQEARKRAAAILARVAVGEDPSGDWRAARGEISVGAAFARALAEHWNTERYCASGWRSEVERLWKGRIEQEFGSCRLSNVSRQDVIRWHHVDAMDTPIAANRALEVLSKVFSLAVDWGLVKMNPCWGIAGHMEAKRDRYATPDEIRRIGISLFAHADSHPRETAFVLLLMFTGARPRALARARWDEIEISGDDWIITAAGKATAKTGEKDKIVLTDAARKILLRLPIREDGLLIGGPIPARFWRVIRKDAGCPDLWVRDWRRTFATIGLSSGQALSTIAELLNHRSTQTTKRYAKLLPTARVEAADMVARELSQLLP